MHRLRKMSDRELDELERHLRADLARMPTDESTTALRTLCGELARVLGREDRVPEVERRFDEEARRNAARAERLRAELAALAAENHRRAMED